MYITDGSCFIGTGSYVLAHGVVRLRVLRNVTIHVLMGLVSPLAALMTARTWTSVCGCV